MREDDDGRRRRSEVLDYWLGEVGPEAWYRGGEGAGSGRSRPLRLPLWEQARHRRARQLALRPGLDAWRSLILLDQFPATGSAATPTVCHRRRRALLARTAILHGTTGAIEAARAAALLHPPSAFRDLGDQDLSVRSPSLSYGRWELRRACPGHRGIIRRFGRFPHRNAVLGRETTAEEVAFLAGGRLQGRDRGTGGKGRRQDE